MSFEGTAQAKDIAQVEHTAQALQQIDENLGALCI
jgi:hypothetical protein